MRTSRRQPYNPVPYQGKLTIANALTDVTRLAGVEGDGAAYPDSSVGVWPAATNLYTNGGFESGTSTWINGARATWSRSSEQAKFGTYSGKLTCDGTGIQLGISANLSGVISTTTQYVISMWVYIPSGWDGGNVVTSDAATFSGATIVNGTASAALVDQWQRITMTLLTAADVSGNVFLYSSSTPTAGKAIYIDGFQLETGSIATPYIETDGGTASRSAGRIQGPAGVLDETQMWVAARVRTGFSASAGARVFVWLDDANNYIIAEYASGNWGLRRKATSEDTHSVADTVAVGDFVTVIFAATATTLGISVDGAAYTSTASTNIPVLAASSFDIGSQGGTVNFFSGDFKWSAIGLGTKPAPAIVHAFGNNDPLPHMFPKSAQLTFLAHFNGDGTFYRRSV